MSSNLEIEIMFCIRLLIAFACGTLIGLQRKKVKNDDNSIFRTHVLICLCAALVSATSELLTLTYENVDVTRISAQVISGISFVGVGMIVRHGNTINGLTTATTLWAVGAIGIAIGSGAFILGITTTILILLLLIIAKENPDKTCDEKT